MATPTMTMTTLAHQQNAPNKITSSTSSEISTHHAVRRGSIKTGSVRHIIKNLAALSTGSQNYENNINNPTSSTSASSSTTTTTTLSSPSSSSSQSQSQSASISGNNNSENNNSQDLSPVRKHIIEEVNDDSVYSIQLKKITYSCASNISGRTGNSNLVTKCDQIDHRNGTLQRSNTHLNAQQQLLEDNQQSLQWETRQLRTIKGATLEHLVKYVLFMTPAQKRLRTTKKTHKTVQGQQQHHHHNHQQTTISRTNKKINDRNDRRNHRKEDENNDMNDENDYGTADDDDDNEDEDEDDEDPRYVEERNNVAHAMHVLFATYRQFAYPWVLFEHIIRQRPFASVKQFNFILYYWLNNYPEDFWTSQQQQQQQQNHHQQQPNNGRMSSSRSSTPTKSTPTPSIATIHSNGSSSNCSTGVPSDSLETSEDGSSIYSEYTISSNSSSNSSFFHDIHNNLSPLTLADQLIAMRHIDEDVKKHCLHLLDMKKDGHNSHHRSLSQLYSSTSSGSSGASITSSVSSSSGQKAIQKTSSILDLDAKFIAQQLTAIDLENFLTLKPYTLLSNVRSKTKIETMIRNFNLLSRHVIVTILQSATPHLVTQHWIEVAQQLRKMRNFNSLKATIAGLTNESIHRLKNCIWNRLSRSSLNSFQYLSSIVDDVNNQTLLRHTQLFIEGTSKVALDESFGTIPYLGTFLTDITMINTRYSNHIKTDNSKDKKLINFEKCAKQYEILMQMQLLQKNAIAALQQQQQQNYHLGPIYSLNHYLSLRSQTVPSIPRVARIFRNWFQLSESEMLNDKECYQISLNIEPNVNKTKTNK